MTMYYSDFELIIAAVQRAREIEAIAVCSVGGKKAATTALSEISRRVVDISMLHIAFARESNITKPGLYHR